MLSAKCCPFRLGLNVLTHRLMPPYSITYLGHHWFRWWLVVCSVPSHNLNPIANLLIMSLWHLETKFNEIWIKIQYQFKIKQLHLQMLSAKQQPYCSGPDAFVKGQHLYLKGIYEKILFHRSVPTPWKKNLCASSCNLCDVYMTSRRSDNYYKHVMSMCPSGGNASQSTLYMLNFSEGT